MDTQATIDVMVANWEVYQEQIVKAVGPLTADQLALRAAPHLRSIGEIAAHMVGARARWLGRALDQNAVQMGALADWDSGAAPVRSAAEIVDGLAVTWAVIENGLARWTPAEMVESITRVDHGEAETYTRAWVIWHLIEHDLHHGGEISLTLGMHSLTAPDI